MQPDVQKPGISYPTLVTQYNGVSDFGALNPMDTESDFTLVGSSEPIADGFFYTLPGLPYNILTTPGDKLLKATLLNTGAGTAQAPYAITICPPDYALLPVPLLADFRAIVFQTVGDFARVEWTGTLWSVYETGGSTVVIVPGQTLP